MVEVRNKANKRNKTKTNFRLDKLAIGNGKQNINITNQMTMYQTRTPSLDRTNKNKCKTYAQHNYIKINNIGPKIKINIY